MPAGNGSTEATPIGASTSRLISAGIAVGMMFRSQPIDGNVSLASLSEASPQAVRWASKPVAIRRVSTSDPVRWASKPVAQVRAKKSTGLEAHRTGFRFETNACGQLPLDPDR